MSVHRLVQAVTADQMPADLASAWRQAAAAVVEAALPADPRQPGTWPVFAALLPHAQAALPADSGGMVRIASYLGDSGSYVAARELWRGMREDRAKTWAPRTRAPCSPGPSSPAGLARRGMRPGPGTSSPRCCPSASGCPAPSTRTPWAPARDLAFWTGEAGDAAGARDQFAALLPVRERVSGAEHPDTLTDRWHLALWTGAAGDAAGARDQYAALLPVRERVSGAEHPDTLTTRGQLARWTGEAGDAAGARDQFAALLPVRERVLGAEHPDTLRDPRRPRLLHRVGGGCGRGPGPVRRAAAHLRAGAGPRAPLHPDRP